MNRLEGHITAIDVSGQLSVVTVEITRNIRLRSIVIETPDTADYLVIGGKISMLFKETEVILSTGETCRISLRNQIRGTITRMETDTLLSKVILRSAAGDITSIVNTESVASLGLSEGSEVTALIKMNEVMLSE